MKFKLVRYFSLTSIVAFVAVMLVLAFTQRHITISNMLTIDESNNVNLTRTFANSLWSEFAPFVERAGSLSLEELRNAPEQERLRQSVVGLMRGLNVIKVKVYDLDGLTVFSTEAKQIGDDKSGNQGFLSARDGVPASELTHRDSFSAFEETIEDRDVISSYVPIVHPVTGQRVGVFEIYKDVTPFLQEVNATTQLVLGVVVGALALLFGILYLIVRRADRIITEQDAQNTRAQLQLAQNEKMASLGQMVAGVAHELNTPLAFARSNLAMIGDSIEELRTPLKWGMKIMRYLRDHQDRDSVSLRFRINPQTRMALRNFDEQISVEQLGQMLSETLVGMDHISELVVNLRDFTRLDRARIDHYEINKGIETTLYIAKSSMAEQIAVDLDLGDVPAIRCMPSQINQVLINLITNAAQALGNKGRISIRSRQEGDHVLIEVEDNGPGIPKETLERIFEPYFTTKEAGQGTGLGLSIVQDIIKEHGGEIDVRSKVGKGTCFSIRLPVTPVCEDLAIAA
ncbi:MAG: hypothetical protein Kow006_09450 [Gammaproteobacteria bacterium]